MIIDNTVVVQEINVDVQENSAVGNIKLVNYVCINLKNKKCYCIETAPVPPSIPTCFLEGNRVISMNLLGQFIKTITEHSAPLSNEFSG